MTADTKQRRAEPLGTTYARLELLGERDFMRRVSSVEKRAGIKTGVRFMDGERYVVSLQVYPKPKFYRQKAFEDGTFGEPSPVDDEFMRKSASLKLV